MNRGPISWSAAFSVDRNAYLEKCTSCHGTVIRVVKIEYVPVSPEKEEISLIVESDDLTPLELWHGREKRLKHPTNRVT